MEDGEAELPNIWAEPYSEERRKRYAVGERLGEGAFGEVHKAIDGQAPGGGSRIVALKTIRGDAGGISRGAFREMQALRRLRHPNVLRLLDVFPRETSVVLVLEMAPSDLAEILEQSPHPLPLAEVKAYTTMLLRGLAHVHAAGLLHRDVKPGNLLVDAGGVLKLADFGQARPRNEGRLYSFQVGTRWYRAPELLLSSRKYGPGVDIWSAGCVLAEMLNHRPLFAGHSDIDQIARIFRALGTPTEKTWSGVAELPDWGKLYFAEAPPQPPNRLFWGAGAAAANLASRLLSLDPEKRPSAAAALQDPWFSALPLAAAPAELQSWPRRGRSRALRRESYGVGDIGPEELCRAWENPSTPPGSLGGFAEHWLG